MATAVLAALFSLGFAAGNAFGQDEQDASAATAGRSAARSAIWPGHGKAHGPSSMTSVDDQLKHLTKKLKLSDDQQAKLKPILEDQRKQMDADSQ